MKINMDVLSKSNEIKNFDYLVVYVEDFRLNIIV